MHRRISELLPKAKGESKSVFALNLDVRGFSKFSLEVDSVETALYIRKLYQKILGDYFPDVSFFKPTGDGLLLVFEIDEGNAEVLNSMSNEVVSQSLKLVSDFPTLLDDDDWIYFPMPKRVGVGIARGAACRLTAEDLTLDYSGTVLNIASRLMDIARPEGVVLDQTFPFNLLQPTAKDQFEHDHKVFLRSVAEEFPRSVYYLSKWTTISPANRRPLEKVDWKEYRKNMTFKEFCDMGPSFLVDLEAEPVDAAQINVRIEYPVKAPKKGRQDPLIWEMKPSKKKWTYRSEAGRPRVSLNIEAIAEKLAKEGVKRTWPLTLIVRYPT